MTWDMARCFCGAGDGIQSSRLLGKPSTTSALLPAPELLPRAASWSGGPQTFIADTVQTADHLYPIPGFLIQDRQNDLSLRSKGDDGDTDLDLKAEDLWRAGEMWSGRVSQTKQEQLYREPVPIGRTLSQKPGPQERK